ncbi:LCP family protein [Patulibacter sp.]|uniref:LCP family protein n=1 Tax=Patulibacter sp. TaxID=1912859 RepID=UPI002722DD49|nr:LCP family protein [Patulibacter sp.]MDO9407530.1 LCP family protein [Patulibacter sp.]
MTSSPHVGRRLASHIVMAGGVVAVVTAGALATVVNSEAQHVTAPLAPIAPGTLRILDDSKPGAAQTLLLTGLDHRYADGPKAPSRSDTMMLVRLDPKAKATTVLTLPRDLRVTSLGPPGQQKLNSAWAIGRSTLLTKTIRTTLLGTPAEPFRINDVISIRFDAFAKTVNHFGCLYAEVDRKYFVAPNSGHAQIDQPAGYQLLCGEDALAYVRFRVGDSDIIREARQANYVTDVRSQIDPLDVLTGNLLGEIGKYVGTNVKTPRQLLGLAKLLVGVAELPTSRIKLGDLSDATDGSGDLLTTPAALARAKREFLHPKVARQRTKPAPKAKAAATKAPRRRAAKVRATTPATLTTDTAGVAQAAAAVAPEARGIEVQAPTLRYGRGAYEPEMTRGYSILDRSRRPRWPSYRIVATTGDNGQYYGVEGTTWKTPPVLQLATDEVRLGGRTWKVQYDGRNVRRLLWQAPGGTYWITNTLTDELTPREMYALARSVRRAG